MLHYMKQDIRKIIICLFLIVSLFSITIDPRVYALNPQSNEPPMFSFLCEDTIVYCCTPQNAELIIEYEHAWAYGNATFTLYDEAGQYYDHRVFSPDETHTIKTIQLAKERTYKLAATGVNFRYTTSFNGPVGNYRCVVAAMPPHTFFEYLPIQFGKLSYLLMQSALVSISF